ncbi:MAG: hypothetical protein BWK76_00840 [Desulfobulbaceae bacterium A2]|nr:MAG: hypothetical protein BWK76_00840 [Desulfobulbaceae bacterium A2]
MDTLPIRYDPSLTQSSTTVRLKKNDKQDAKQKTSQEFEALFIQQMFHAMRQTIPDGGLLKKDNATRIYEDMLDAERARVMARQQSLGIAEAIERQIQRKK